MGSKAFWANAAGMGPRGGSAMPGAILLAAVAIRLAWALILPPLGGSDEAQHLLYARQVRQHLTVDVNLQTTAPSDLLRLSRAAAAWRRRGGGGGGGGGEDPG